MYVLRYEALRSNIGKFLISWYTTVKKRTRWKTLFGRKPLNKILMQYLLSSTRRKEIFYLLTNNTEKND
jgi:hypothetical protein